MSDTEHPEPAEIDLGLQHTFDVEPVIAGLEAEGIRAYLVAQTDVPAEGGIGPRQCRVLVAPADEARAREVFTEVGFL